MKEQKQRKESKAPPTTGPSAPAPGHSECQFTTMATKFQLDP